MESKVCTKCNKNLAISEYYTITSKYGSTYTYNYCKKCHYTHSTKAIAKKWRKDNKERWHVDVKKATKAYHGRQSKGVYLLVTTKGLYIGATDKFESRIQQHRTSNFGGNMKFKGAKVLYATLVQEVNDRKERLEAEKRWIKKLRPSLNLVFNSDYKKESKIGGKYIKK
tara:strand:- start:598 stop:1104 length:507 start_codon:yes stop_codon:yes gene_type:complete